MKDDTFKNEKTEIDLFKEKKYKVTVITKERVYVKTIKVPKRTLDEFKEIVKTILTDKSGHICLGNTYIRGSLIETVTIKPINFIIF